VREGQPITRTAVNEDRRPAIFPTYGKQYFLQLEIIIFQVMEEYCADYRGGLWSMWELSNDCFYMAPNLPERTVKMVCAGNYFEGSMSTDAAGIVACLVAFNRLAWSVPEPEHFNRLFYALRDWALQHAECKLILAAID
jgi:hypothetical protein